MRYDVVIATLNRPDSLIACVSNIERQTEKPVRVIVVDASDDHQAVKNRVMRERDHSIEWLVVESDIRSSARQRNIGLTYVEQDVVLMPDDDSMLYPSAAQEMMAAYRADVDGQIAGVSAVGVSRPPDSTHKSQRLRERAFKDKIGPLRNAVESRIIREPFHSYPETIWHSRDIPEWVDGERFALVSSVGGYRMSLRSAVVKSHLFDETLGYGIGYALHEDIELSMRLQTAGYLLVAAQQASVFHDVHPSRRAGGFNYGFCWIANYIYVCRRNMPEHSASWRTDLPNFLRYKLSLYSAQAVLRRDAYSRDVLAGARVAWEARTSLMQAKPEALEEVYKSLCDLQITR